MLSPRSIPTLPIPFPLPISAFRRSSHSGAGACGWVPVLCQLSQGDKWFADNDSNEAMLKAACAQYSACSWWRHTLGRGWFGCKPISHTALCFPARKELFALERILWFICSADQLGANPAIVSPCASCLAGSKALRAATRVAGGFQMPLESLAALMSVQSNHGSCSGVYPSSCLVT